MSQHDDRDPQRPDPSASDPHRVDPYATEPPPQQGPASPPPPAPQPYPQSYPQPYPQSYPQSPSQYPPGYPPSGSVQGPAGPGGPGAGVPQKPPTVVSLRQVMVAGAVVAALQGLYGVLSVDDVMGESVPDLEQVAADAGVDAGTLASTASGVAIGVIVVGTLVSVGLWLLFARLFDRGSGRVVGTVLAAVNGFFLLLGVVQPAGPLEALLSLLSLALVVFGLVLLWRPVTTAWFRAVAAARGRAAWG